MLTDRQGKVIFKYGPHDLRADKALLTAYLAETNKDISVRERDLEDLIAKYTDTKTWNMTLQQYLYALSKDKLERLIFEALTNFMQQNNISVALQ